MRATPPRTSPAKPLPGPPASRPPGRRPRADAQATKTPRPAPAHVPVPVPVPAPPFPLPADPHVDPHGDPHAGVVESTVSGLGTVRPDDALELLYFAFREVVLEPDRVLARRGLGRVHHRVLFMCRRCGDLSLGELMRVLDVSKQALHRPLRELAEAGLLVAETDATDRRTRRLRLTAAGRALEESLSGMQRAAFARAFATVGETGAEAWARVMVSLGGGQTAAGLRAAPPEPDAEPHRAPSSKSRGRIEPARRRRGAT